MATTLRTALFFIFFLAGKAFAAAYEIKPLLLMFDGNPSANNSDTANARTIDIKNNSDKTLYLSISTEKIINAGLKGEKSESHLQSDPKEFGIILNNDKLIIPPQQQRSVVAMSLKNPENLHTDAVYRIVTTPMESAQFQSPKGDKISGGVNFVLKYSISAFVMPQNKTSDVSIKQSGSHLTLKNQGNSINSVTALYSCPQNTKKEEVGNYYKNHKFDEIKDTLKCQVMPGASFLYAGSELDYHVPKNKKMMVILYNNGDYNTVDFRDHS